MTEGLKTWGKEDPEFYKKTIQGISLGHFADPEKDIGRVCSFLTSDDASYITSETFTLQGRSGLCPQALYCNHTKH